MAKGDVVSGISAAVAAAGNLDYQPAAGVEALITQVASDSGATDLGVRLFNGTTDVLIKLYNASGGAANDGAFFKILVNNTNYLRLKNGSGSSQDLGYCGIQTK